LFLAGVDAVSAGEFGGATAVVVVVVVWSGYEKTDVCRCGFRGSGW
jgi:hypothetical protein